jgi:peptidoglycan/LPS O-acetylase OafA/YrhL
MPFAGLTHFVLPVLLITSLLMVLARGIDRKSLFYRNHVNEEVRGERFHSIDGLRGFLAIGVMYHHSVITYFYYLTGRWTTPPSRLSTLFGQGGVAMFFMVTALLFWSRALASDGRLDLQRFFTSRVRRMVPMYVVASVALIFTALALTHFRLVEPPMQIAKESSAWLLFTLPGIPDINGLKDTYVINTVFWSLVYEWRFYLIFPLLIFFARGWGSWVLLACAAVLIHWYTDNNVEWYFIYGALTATIFAKLPDIRKFFVGPVGSLVVCAVLFMIYKNTPTAYDPTMAPLFFAVFFIIASGNTMFGLLTSRPARLLGTVSYSIYLMHNFWIYLVFRLVNHFTEVPSLSIPGYWTITAGVALLTVGISAVTFRYIEFPFLNARRPKWMMGADHGRTANASNPR